MAVFLYYGKLVYLKMTRLFKSNMIVFVCVKTWHVLFKYRDLGNQVGYRCEKSQRIHCIRLNRLGNPPTSLFLVAYYVIDVTILFICLITTILTLIQHGVSISNGLE